LSEKAELEVIILFADGFCDPSAIGARIARLRSVNISLVVYAVLAGVRSFVDEAFFLQTLPQLLRSLFVTGLGGADKVVVGDAHVLKQRPELRRHCVSELLRGSSGGAGGALNLLSVLVCAGKEKRVIAQQ